MHTRLLITGRLIGTSMLLAAAMPAVAGTVTANFNDGNDYNAPVDPGDNAPTSDSFGGAISGGWDTTWKNYNTGIASVATRVVNSSTGPFYHELRAGGGNYLQYDMTGNYGGTSTWVRAYGSAATGGVNTNLVHTVSFKIRLDSDPASRFTTDSRDFIRVFDNTHGGAADVGSVGWAVSLTGGVNGGHWTFESGDGAGTGGLTKIDTGLTLQQEYATPKVFTFTITVHPVTGAFNVASNYTTWDATITDGTSTFTQTGMRFRANTPTSGRFLEFSGGVAGLPAYDLRTADRLAYSIDDIVVSDTAVPEPATLTMAGMTLLLALRRRR